MQTKQDGRLGTEKIGKLMLELALPSVLAQIVNVLYNIVDRIYIGRIPDVGSLALTGVGVTFPIITIISAFAGFASGGGAPLAAIALGQKNRDRAEKILGSSTSLLLFFSVCLMAFFSVFIPFSDVVFFSDFILSSAFVCILLFSLAIIRSIN